METIVAEIANYLVTSLQGRRFRFSAKCGFGGGGLFWPATGNQWKNAVSPHIAKSYFETFIIYDDMQNSGQYIKNPKYLLPESYS